MYVATARDSSEVFGIDRNCSWGDDRVTLYSNCITFLDSSWIYVQPSRKWVMLSYALGVVYISKISNKWYPSFSFVDGIRFIRDVSAFVMFTSIVTRTCTNLQKHLTPMQRALRNPKLPKRRCYVNDTSYANFLAGASLTLLGLRGSRLIPTHFWLTYNLLCSLQLLIVPAICKSLRDVNDRPLVNFLHCPIDDSSWTERVRSLRYVNFTTTINTISSN